MKTINKEELRQFVENNPKLVTRRESLRYPGLFVLKYAKRVFYDNLWHVSPYLMECRGLVVDSDYNVIVRPLTKVFNYGENGTGYDIDPYGGAVCDIERKVNGFFAAVTFVAGYDELIISTTGSLDSKFVDIAAQWIDPIADSIMNNIEPGMTLMFEICDPTDQHIIEEKYGAYLLSGHNHDHSVVLDNRELDFLAESIGVSRPEWDCGIPLREVLEMVKHVKHEGFMVKHVDSGLVFKIKSPYYLTTKFFARMAGNKFTDLIGNKQTVRQKVEEEYYPLVDYLNEWKEEFVAMNEQEKVSFIRNFIESMGEDNE